MISASIGKIAPGQKAILGTARWYQPGSRPLVVFGHGYLSDASFVQITNRPEWDGLIASGFPCVATDLGGTATFGNATGVAAVAAAIAFAQGELSPKPGKVLLYGGSMSTLTLLNYANAHPSNVAAVAIVTPAPDLQYLHDIAPTGTQNGFAVAEWLPNLAPDIEASAGGAAKLNSSYYAATSPVVYAPSSLAGIPIHFWTSPDDVVAGGPTVTAPFISALAGSASETLLPIQGALGHSATGIDISQVITFFDQSS